MPLHQGQGRPGCHRGHRIWPAMLMATWRRIPPRCLAAVTEAREHGVADDQIIDPLADAIKRLLYETYAISRG